MFLEEILIEYFISIFIFKFADTNDKAIRFQKLV